MARASERDIDVKRSPAGRFAGLFHSAGTEKLCLLCLNGVKRHGAKPRWGPLAPEGA
jgi:hypothetical protein